MKQEKTPIKAGHPGLKEDIPSQLMVVPAGYELAAFIHCQAGARTNSWCCRKSLVLDIAKTSSGRKQCVYSLRKSAKYYSGLVLLTRHTSVVQDGLGIGGKRSGDTAWRELLLSDIYPYWFIRSTRYVVDQCSANAEPFPNLKRRDLLRY